MNKYKEMKYERVIKELHEEIDRISENYDELLTKYKKLKELCTKQQNTGKNTRRKKELRSYNKSWTKC